MESNHVMWAIGFVCLAAAFANFIERYERIELAKSGLQQCIVRPNYDIIWMKDCPKIEELNDEGGDSAEDKV